MKRAVISVVALSLVAYAFACVGDDPSAAPAVVAVADAAFDGPSAEGGADAAKATDAAPCDLSLEFSVVEPLTSLNGTTDESAPTLTNDERQIVYASTRDEASGPASDNTNLLTASRSGVDVPFGPGTPALTSSLNVAAKLDSDPTLSDDGLLLIWAQRQIEAGNDHVLHYAQRGGTSEPFAPGGVLVFEGDGGPGGQFPKGSVLLPNGAFYFAARRTAQPDYTIHRAAQSGNVGHYGAAVEQKLSTGDSVHASSAAVMPDEKKMYVALANGADTDIAVLERSDPAAPWGAPQTLAKLSSGAPDEPRWLSRDGCRLYVTSSRSGSKDLYVARRQ
jgi:hypothetical protein